MMLFLFQNKENKILFGPPPSPYKKERLKDTISRDMTTRTIPSKFNISQEERKMSYVCVVVDQYPIIILMKKITLCDL